MIVVVDSGGANVASVLFAFERLEKRAVFTADPEIVVKASHVVLPGVGAAGTAMRALRKNGLDDCVRGLKQPVLGICLGMQILFSRSAEDRSECLDLVSGNIEKLSGGAGPVPHTGWNQVMLIKEDPLFDDVPDNAFFYFVHSYYAPRCEASLALTDYGTVFTSALRKDNFFGCQFHPERSGATGARLLLNFTRL